jgi:hypothetical protein
MIHCIQETPIALKAACHFLAFLEKGISRRRQDRRRRDRLEVALMRKESEENVLSNYVEGLAASGTEAEHGEVLVE